MNTRILFFVWGFCLFFGAMQAQIVYHDAAAFPLLGKATTASKARYQRLPDSLQHISRPPVWALGRNSAGLAIRFRSNSTTISARWTVVQNFHMNHMTDTGVKGLDLYCLEGSHWRFVNSGRPRGRRNRATIIAHMKPMEREYMLYLPLYDGVDSLSIGVDSLASIGQPAVDLPSRRKPLVFYGTSILQGGCASRPGMDNASIIGRRLNRECINLGFSGNGLLDLEIARLMASVDAGAYILDCVPNATVEQMKERMLTFYHILREGHPDTPILFVEDPVFPHTLYDQRMAKEVADKNHCLHEIFEQLKHAHEKHIRYVSSRNMIGHDGEATVDGEHFTDLGMMRYADLLTPILCSLLK
jgi:hypothetical protein